MRARFIIIFLVFCSFSFGQKKSFELKEWSLSYMNMILSADVPGNVITDLCRNEIIPHAPNSPATESLINSDGFDLSFCSYFTEFDSQDLLEYENVELEFDGLDTYAQIFLNDSLIGKSSNMFRSLRIDIKPLIKVGVNTLRVDFTSPLKHHEKTLKNRPFALPSGNESGPNQVSCYSRKAAYQFGWDWAPRMVGMGIWRPVRINSWSNLRIQSHEVRTKGLEGNKAVVNHYVTIVNNTDKRVRATLLIDGQKKKLKVKPGTHQFVFEQWIDEPELWYPNGYGKPVLHQSKIQLYQKKQLIDSKSTPYGIATIDLIQEKDSIGTSFYFVVNGQKVFAKGANYVPISPFPSSVDSSEYERIIELIKEANMNMIRVWGGGIYESDYFYDLCDQNGIMVWQDFMFANSMYPSDDKFCTDVFKEAIENIKRLRKHPCIAVWCGNNEIEVAWNNWGWQDQFGWSEADSARIWKNYEFIFHEAFPQFIREESEYTPYVSTSPLSNWGTEENFNHSSMHYWGVWHGTDDFDDFQDNVGRFMVEYGFQSYPSHELLSKYVSAPINMEKLDELQKSYVGNKLIIREMQKRYGEVPDIQSWLALTQHLQAEAYKEAIQQHRLNAPHCMGTLFWQLNDTWPGPSWSVIDSELNTKIAYDEVATNFQPIMMKCDTVNDQLEFRVVSDYTETADVQLDIKLFIGDQLKFEHEFNEKLNFLEPKLVFQYDLSGPIYKKNWQQITVFYEVRNRITDKMEYADEFYFGLSPAERKILNK